MDFSADDRLLTELDHVRLTKLLHREGSSGFSPEQLRLIEELLDAVDVVPSKEIEGSVVTMGSQVKVREVSTGQPSTLTVVYPAHASPEDGKVSVLSAVGLNLIGQRVGAVARWTTPGGQSQALEILEVLFQPEASGDYLS